jgi:hypothetical protein
MFSLAALQKSQLILVESLLFHPVATLHFLSIELEISCVKWAHLLSQNQIREILMDLDSNEEKYYPSEDKENNKPLPPLRRSSIPYPPSPDFSASSYEDEDIFGNVAGQQLQPCLWTLLLNPEGRYCTPLLGPPMGRAGKLHT